ncbi:GntR family transcriptional regulator / MocR family aminotransferase [Dethiosulfatibacter aminovorans DSM 17477]|uniref:GntR family transcriptional regulator / MocR family aminotransferase n=1 Tax=Dethiosulfatibacter aminovorans DSM 17477 TaxID=1121476 RepID=A0A1M6C7R3_9FIRM|nr:PLP-dependent aminotransferase family protein [Dethiosulfatibacter aminovorans]SHI57032.1 GntR family transcriptional regulator / MocR family aminotransferase [Dethiosulfatibacter aminovorans DSM 17477]
MIFTFIPDKESKKPVYIQLYEHIRDEIKNQTIKKGEKLPSIRETASTYKISKTTVENSYFQLLTEGYIESLPKKGYFAQDLRDYFSGEGIEPTPMESENTTSYNEAENHDKFKNENVHLGSIDTKIWKKLYNRVLTDFEEEVYSSGSYQGEYKLRYEISNFVNKTRGGKTRPEQIVIGAGIQYLIGILAGMVKNQIKTAAVEYPGYEKAKYIFEDYGFQTVDIPVKEDGLNLQYLEDSQAEIAYVSPSHQFPTGSLMPIGKRLDLLSWAEKNKSFILEDDYDSLIRFESLPVPCLQGLDKDDRVIYLGSFSKILTPAMRMSYMILPERLLESYRIISSKYTQSASKLEQLTLASFIEEGHIYKHLRKIKRIYSRKRNLIKEYLEYLWGYEVTMISADSGLHAVVSLESKKSAEEIIDFFADKGVLVNIIRKKGDVYEISISYSGLSFEELELSL